MLGDTLTNAMHWGETNYPNASQYHHAAFANSVACAIHHAAGGYGGPSIRQFAAENATNTSGILWEDKPVEEVYQFIAPICYGPLTDLHYQMWDTYKRISHDNDPEDVRKYENQRSN